MPGEQEPEPGAENSCRSVTAGMGCVCSESQARSVEWFPGTPQHPGSTVKGGDLSRGAEDVTSGFVESGKLACELQEVESPAWG